jgi:hypothetical protein
MNTTSKQITRNRLATTIKLFAASALLVLATAVTGSALTWNFTQDHAGHAAGQELKVPQTAPEYRARAEQYQKKAAEYRQEVATHKQMLADYSKGVAKNPKDLGENPYIKKMRLHCEKYIKAAENLALEADEMAKYHTQRAKELEGK